MLVQYSAITGKLTELLGFIKHSFVGFMEKNQQNGTFPPTT